MSEEEDYEPTREDALFVMQNRELLAEEGVRITPKGHMATVLMQMGVDIESAEKVSEEMSRRIFDDGWTYIPNESLRPLDVPDEL
jgi:hypothetical protein